MSNVIETLTIPNLRVWWNLAEDLDGILSRIAYDGKNLDWEYIERQQDKIVRHYGGLVREQFEESRLGLEGLRVAEMRICYAYYGLLGILDTGKPRFVGVEAENILHENLILHLDNDEV